MENLIRQSLVFCLLGLALAGCQEVSACDPETFGLPNTRAATRELTGLPASAGACARPRLEVIQSSEELRRFHEGLAAANDAGTASEPPAVDFSRERVLVREGRGEVGINWIVTQGDVATVGLRGCKTVSPETCIVTVTAVSALVTKAEAKECEAVACGNPSNLTTPKSDSPKLGR